MGENFFGITDSGRQRDNNEDSFIAQQVFNKRCILACVIDGVGGYAGGEVAAELTRDAIIRHFRKLPANITTAMLAALDNANERIFKEKDASKQNDKMACVVTLAIVEPEKNKFCYAHVGDTRLYLFRDSSLVKITHDHSTVGFLEESGRLTEAAAMQHPKRNEVNKALGYETGIRLSKDFIDTGESPFLPGDTILLCSDGLTDMVASARIISILNNGSDLKTRARQLVDAANEAGGKDNITVVLVHNDKEPLKLEATKPLLAAKNNNNGHDGHSIDLSEQLAETKVNLDERAPGKPSNSKKLLVLLVILCLLFFAGFAWFFAGSLQKNREPKLLMPPKEKPRNVLEQNLADSIRASPGKAIISLTPGQSILITDSLVIDKDSLHIKGNGNTIVSDSTYRGPGFVLSPSCRYILFDSLTMAGFQLAILVRDKGLHLKNVRFTDCKIPIQFQQQLPRDAMVSGTQAQTFFYHKDSLYK